MRIGIYSPNWIGDAVLSLPFVQQCRQAFPEAHITIITKRWVAAVFENQPGVDKLLTFDKEELRGFLPTTRSGLRLRASGIDTFYLLSDSLRCAYLARLAGAPIRIGFSRSHPSRPGQWRGPLLTQAVPPPTAPLHRARRYLLLLHDAPRKNRPDSPRAATITLREDELAWGRAELARLQLTMPVAVFPASVAPSRQVPLEKWVGFLAPFVEAGKELLILGGPTDTPTCEALYGVLPGGSAISLCGRTTLRQSMAIIAHCDGALAADSGLGHIAANLGVKTVSVFGAGDAAETRPLGPRAGVVSQPVHCSPCRKNTCFNKEEPLLCIHAIPAPAIWEAYHNL